MRPKVLRKLSIQNVNFGACSDGNSWSKTKDHGCIESINPSSEKLIARVFNANSNDYHNVLKNASQTFSKWRKTPAPKRGELIRELGELLRENKEYLGELVAMEMGKSLQEGLGEVQEMIDMADFAVGQSRMLYGKSMHSERVEHRMYEQWHPLGVIAVITAFNFPIAVWAWNAFIGAICGNTIVWKPSSKTPLCALAVQHLCNVVMKKHNIEGLFNLLITDKRELSNRLLEDKRLSLVSFTGSSEVGLHAYETVANRMGRCLLECSGNNAVIVDETADLNLAIPAIAFGAIGTAGQRCTSTRRVFLHESIYDNVVSRLIKAYESITIGDPLNPKHTMGPLIDAKACRQFERTVQSATNAGGKVLFGGNAVQGTGFFVEPTLISAQNDWPIVQSETFAPILYVMPYKTLEEAITLQNNVRQGLSSAIFTKNLQAAETFLSARGSDCGIANVNLGTSGAEIGGAFGGEKDTGGGREAGSDAWKTYMRRQTNTINWGSELPLAQGIKFKFE